MKIKLFKNSFISHKNIINQDQILDFLLFKYGNIEFDPAERNGKDIKITSFKETYSTFEDFEKYDLAMVENYPFFNNQTLFFSVKVDNKINNYKSVIFDFELIPMQSFKLNQIFTENTKLPIAFNHLKVNSEFEIIERLELKENNFFQLNQPSPINLNLIDFKQRNFFFTKNEKPIISNLNLKYWSIYLVKKEFFNDQETVIDASNSQNLQVFNNKIPTPLVYVLLPNQTSDITFKSNNNNFVVDGFKSQKAILDDPLFLAKIAIDYPISPNFIYDEANNLIKIDNSGFVIFEKDENSFIVANDLDNIRQQIVPENYENLFDWKIPTINFDDENTWFFQTNNEIILNFFPFKNIGVGFFSETNSSANYFQLNNTLKMPQNQDVLLNNDIFIIRKTIPTINSLFFSDLRPESDEDSFSSESNAPSKIIGDRLLKVNRSLSLPSSSDAWKLEELNKSNSSAFQSVYMPAAEVLIGAAVGGPVGWATAVGTGIKAANGLQRQRNLKNSPDSITNAASDGIAELLFGFDSKALILKEPTLSDKESIAFIFHKYGYTFFDRKIFINDLFKNKLIFEFLKISDFAKNETFNYFYNQKEFVNLLWKELNDGFHFWNFDNNWPDDFKTEIINFNFNLKNPDK